MMINMHIMTMPMKCSERAFWWPPMNLKKRGNFSRSAGDMAAPVTIMNGAIRKTTAKYASCWSASYGSNKARSGVLKLKYVSKEFHASGIMSQDVGTMRRHRPVAKSRTT